MNQIIHYDMHGLNHLTPNYKAYVIASGLSVPRHRPDIYDRWLEAVKAMWVWSKLSVSSTERAIFSKYLNVAPAEENLVLNDIIAILIKDGTSLSNHITFHFVRWLAAHGPRKDFDDWLEQQVHIHQQAFGSFETAEEVARLAALESGSTST